MYIYFEGVIMTDSMYTATSPTAHLPITDLPFDSRIMFSNHKDVYKKGIEKEQNSLLKKLNFIKPFLKNDEPIVFISKGMSPTSIFEQLLAGTALYWLKRSLFVFTTKRFFHIPTKGDYTYRNIIAQVLYEDCSKISMKRNRLALEYKNGKKEQFTIHGYGSRKKIKAFFETFAAGEGQGTDSERVHLCPACTKELIPDQYVCPNCHLEFKNRQEGKRVSLLYPGGGFFYTRHPVLGVLDAIAEAYLTVLLILMIYNIVNGSTTTFEPVIIIAVLLIIEKATSVYHANHFIREYIPKEKNISLAQR
jgi:hypothetical protein